MTILAQQSVATFHIWDGELVLWQPEEASQYWPRTEYTARYTMPPETCPWTEEMVQELWTTMLTEKEGAITTAANELKEVEDFNDMVDEMDVDINEPSYFNEWNQSVSRVAFICDARGIAQKFAPEVLIQRDNLNDMWNADCQLEDENRPGGQIYLAPIDYVPESQCSLEFVSIGDNFARLRSRRPNTDQSTSQIPQSITSRTP